jgi:hypothetical protein
MFCGGGLAFARHSQACRTENDDIFWTLCSILGLLLPTLIPSEKITY